MGEAGGVVVVLLIILLVIGGVDSCVDQRRRGKEVYAIAHENAYNAAYPKAFDKGNQFYFDETNRLTRSGWFLSISEVIILLAGIVSLRKAAINLGHEFKAYITKLSLIKYLRTNPNFKDRSIWEYGDDLETLVQETDQYHLQDVKSGYKTSRSSIKVSYKKTQAEFVEACEILLAPVKAAKVYTTALTAVVMIATALIINSCGPSAAEQRRRGTADGTSAGESDGYWDGTWNYFWENIGACFLIGVIMLVLIFLVYLLILKVHHVNQELALQNKAHTAYLDHFSRLKSMRYRGQPLLSDSKVFKRFIAKKRKYVGQYLKGSLDEQEQILVFEKMQAEYLSEVIVNEFDVLRETIEELHLSQARPEVKLELFSQLVTNNLS